MTAVFATSARIGGDPRHLDAFKHLCRELERLSHPACPDVDWLRVESLCLVVFKENGVDLQSTVAFTLAQGNLRGVEGLVQGFALLEGLAGQWPDIWPTTDATRLEILDWLYRQVLVLLRGLGGLATGVASLQQLQTQVHRVQGLLLGHVDQLPATWPSLQQYIAALLQQLERGRLPLPGLPPTFRAGEPERVMPVFILPPAPAPAPVFIAPRRRKARIAWGLGVAGLLVVLAGGAYWQAQLREAMRLPEAVSLDSLAVFDAGSAEFRDDATKPLMHALVQLKVKPGWLIVITGHADNTGNSTRNQALSRDRALAVRDWMQRMSPIPDDCFAIRDAADSQPVASNDNELGRAANRRVDIQLVPQAGVCGAG
ncbi:type VI secretion system ImpA family N-terminal domain-containing protein [Pseudomonas sp. 148P]|uniref:Type VI secretion system ImpA family N-terminal domain-containing protein n=1 Tax=Pseudomonas ulcerans TaxID=3115852 RepID=A0ABU7I0C8_9PSED|nr:MULTISPECIES: type VI secretion system ImpA family N-terminal domain-containing protein [unclassified Pseudomonas]MEE1925806.1 type VI secretion system ImpA family N-terminal domain-containing protein [Pseudomonas sp. 147P]MEE1937138.1 type VI secretion system ImpA family N-terminal domain-containing protein [Pseudomonas sp. 148P]